MSDEDAFLAAIQAAPTDDTLRLVYADWLEEHGRPGGEYLRVECEFNALNPNNPCRDRVHVKLEKAGVGIDPGWLARVSRIPIENCLGAFRFRCPKRWEQLQPTFEEGVRFCGECRKEVFFCGSIDIAQTHAAIDECVAIDPRLVRRPLDLESSLWGDDEIHMGMMEVE